MVEKEVTYCNPTGINFENWDVNLTCYFFSLECPGSKEDINIVLKTCNKIFGYCS